MLVAGNDHVQILWLIRSGYYDCINLSRLPKWCLALGKRFMNVRLGALHWFFYFIMINFSVIVTVYYASDPYCAPLALISLLRAALSRLFHAGGCCWRRLGKIRISASLP